MSEIVKALSIGIIGGADGPTAIFVTASGPKLSTVLLLAAAAIGVALWLRKRKKNR